MKRTLCRWLAVLGWLVPTLLSAQQFAVPAIHSQDPHRFSVKTSLNGPERVWFPTGFYGAALNMSTGEFADDPVHGWKAPEVAFRNFVDKLYAAKLNFARVWINVGMKQKPVSQRLPSDWDYQVVHPYPMAATRGSDKFNVEGKNDEYFDMLAREVAYADDHGIVLQLVLFDCWHVTTGISGYAERDYYKAGNHTTEKLDWTNASDWLNPAGNVASYQKTFVDRVVEAVGNRKNIIWETCNEDLTKNTSTFQGAITPWDRMIEGELSLAEGLPNRLRHLVMPIALPEHRTVAGHATPITRPNAGQPAEETIENMHGRLVSPQWGWNAPLITDNDCCDPPLADYGNIPREKAWAALTAGAHTDFFVDVLGESGALLTRADIVRGMAEVGHLQTFLEDPQVNLVGMQPEDWLVTVNVTGAPPNLTTQRAWTYARRNSGLNERVIYLRALGPYARTAVVSNMPATYTATWFNPRNGARSAATGGPSFPLPSSEDWVLHIKEAPAPPNALAICTQPLPQYVAQNGSATFQAAACQGTPPYTYQWQKSATEAGTYASYGTPTTGTAPAQLTINPAQASLAGFYRVRVTDAAGAQVFSSAARLSFKCLAGQTVLCLQNNRFQVETWYRDNQGVYQPSRTLPAPGYSEWSGFFWFFDPTNIELGVKVLPGSNAWWVFFGAGTDVDYKVTVTDTKSFDAAGNPVKKDYHHAQGTLCDTPDLNAFPRDYAAAAIPVAGGKSDGDGEMSKLAGNCVANSTQLCQVGNRFRVHVLQGGVAKPAEALTTNTGVFWFYVRDNAEVFVKVLDGTQINNAFWVFYGSQTDQQFQVEVTDTANPALPPKVYSNQLGTYCGGGDAWAFPQ